MVNDNVICELQVTVKPEIIWNLWSRYVTAQYWLH